MNIRTWAIILVTWCLLFGVDGRRRNPPLKNRLPPSRGDESEQISCEERSKCGNFSSSLPFHARNCFCDDSCRAYGDCCQDAPSALDPPPGQEPTAAAVAAVGLDTALKRTTSCRRNEDIDRSHEIHIVDHCPRSYQDSSVRRNCENELAPEVFNRLPVTGRTSGVLYRNVYCAVCSGDREFVFWELAYRCSEMSDVTTIDSAEQFRRLIAEPRCTLQLLPPPGMTPRKCKSSIDECDKSWTVERVARKCRSYTSYVYLDLETYKNRHCAICNSVANSSLSCNDLRSPNWERSWDDSSHVQWRYIVYDANTRRASVRSGKNSTENHGNGNEDAARELGNCSRGRVYDVLTDQCRCTVEKCLEMSTTQTSKATALTSVKEEVTRTGQRQRVTTTTAKTRGRKTTATTSVATTKRYAKTTVASTKPAKINRPWKPTVPTVRLLTTLRSTERRASARESTSTRASTISATSISNIATSANAATSAGTGTNTIRYRATVSSIFNLIPSAIVTSADKVSASSVTSTSLRTAAVDFDSLAEKTSKAETSKVEVETGSLLTHVVSLRIETGILENSEPRSRLRVSVAAGSSPRITTSSAVVTPATTNAADIILPDQREDSDDFLSDEAEENGIIDARWRNCSDVRAIFNYDRLQSLASLVATLGSMVCLLVTFVAILLLPLVQTMRGKILLSLALCLFIGQLLYLFALPSNKPFLHQGACYWLGCALHYFTLGGFFWVSVLAFDTSWSVIGDRLEADAVGSGRYVAYFVYAWLTPAAIVVAGVVTDFLGSDRFLVRPCYGQGVCFVAGTFSLLLIFAVPAGILVLISVFVYFLAASHACFEASRATKSKRSENGTRGGTLLALCLFLTLLAALTWVAAFAAAFHGPRITWWAFVALSPTQGIFMFVAFVCRRSVLGQLRRRGNRRGEAERPNGASSATQWSYRRDYSGAMTDQRDLGISNPEFLQNETYM